MSVLLLAKHCYSNASFTVIVAVSPLPTKQRDPSKAEKIKAVTELTLKVPGMKL